jgi:hypothetical protein
MRKGMGRQQHGPTLSADRITNKWNVPSVKMYRQQICDVDSCHTGVSEDSHIIRQLNGPLIRTTFWYDIYYYYSKRGTFRILQQA